MYIALPENVSMIIDTLYKHGYEAYAVGGCIRDSIMGRNPSDWDITTSAPPEQTKAIFKRTVDTGIKHGTITVLIGNESYEVTTYRTDGEYEDSRHPKTVEFITNLEEDLKRRDFTINAMAYNEKDGLIDPFDGIGDIERKLIRCVGDPMERFSEDALRMMRAIRFSAQLSFKITKETEDAIKRLSMTLEKISAERICDELGKLIVSLHPEYIVKAYALGITNVILPEFNMMMETAQNNPYHCYSVGIHTVRAMGYVENDFLLRLTMLLHDIGKPLVRTTDEQGIDHFRGHDTLGAEIAVKVMKRLKLDNDTIRKVKILIYYHDWRMLADMRNVRYSVYKIGEELFPLHLKVQYADVMSHSDHNRKISLQNIYDKKACYERIIAEDQCVSLKKLKLTGRDVLELGCEPGPKVGDILNRTLEMVIDNPEKNQHEFLCEYASNLIKEE